MSTALWDAALWLPLPPITKLVLAALCDRARLEDGKCWPSTRYIAARVSLSERRVQDHLRELEQGINAYVRRGTAKAAPGRSLTRYVNVERIITEGRAAQDSFRQANEQLDATPDDSSGVTPDAERPNAGRSQYERRTLSDLTPDGSVRRSVMIRNDPSENQGARARARPPSRAAQLRLEKEQAST